MLGDEEASLESVPGTIRAWLAQGRCPSALDDEEATFSNVYQQFKTWLGQRRCTSALLDSAASGKAADVERKCFHDLLAEAGNARRPSTNARKRTLRNRSNQAVEAVPRRTEPTSEGAPSLIGKGSEIGTMPSYSILSFYHYIFTDMMLRSSRRHVKKTVVAQNPHKILPLWRPFFLFGLKGAAMTLDGVGEEMGRVKGNCLVV